MRRRTLAIRAIFPHCVGFPKCAKLQFQFPFLAYKRITHIIPATPEWAKSGNAIISFGIEFTQVCLGGGGGNTLRVNAGQCRVYLVSTDSLVYRSTSSSWTCDSRHETCQGAKLILARPSLPTSKPPCAVNSKCATWETQVSRLRPCFPVNLVCNRPCDGPQHP